MKIVDIKVTPIAIADPPLRSSYGLHAPYALRTVIEIVGEDGVIGISECHGGEQALSDFEAVRHLVIGSNVAALTRLESEIDDIFSPSADDDRSQTWLVPGENRSDVSARIFAAIEVAALDLIGRATGLRFCDLLGGAVRDSVPVAAYLFYKHVGGGGAGTDVREDGWGEALDAESIVEQARLMISRYGFQSVKLKGGVLEPMAEAEAIIALRESLGDSMPLRIDPNAAWSRATSVAVARKLDGTLEYLEDPISGIESMGALRRDLLAEGIETPLASNVAVTNFKDLVAAARLDAVQVILSDHHYWGGARTITHLGTFCESFGIGMSMHSNSHLGLSLAAMTHVAAATPHLTYAIDSHYPWQHQSDEIVDGGRISIADGLISVPTGPGLGVDLDRDAVERGHERYRNAGVTKRDDAAEMRKHVDPNWERKVPAW